MRLVGLATLPPPAPDEAKLLAHLPRPVVVLRLPDHILALEQSEVDGSTCKVSAVARPCDHWPGLSAALGVERVLLGLRAAALDDLEI